ncbi:hypothetical protein SAMN05444171_8074 [Bradyrhizobium lablabi]|uniref:Uncharacterized protein n=1 Tax=Bradyrhizobium lablabi TaxID=722472 RepID=A0A1H5LRY8_9BRAD|nr:hypothetical protein SAMN05444171_7863 [Bradyrhizobium lablabi]SEE79161.1 hypothetical protein SAMN05444171_8074 [Bradyrhizobium lablabi]
MTFMEFIGPYKAFGYGLGIGFVIGCIYTGWVAGLK